MLAKFWDENGNYINSYNVSSVSAQGLIPNVNDTIYFNGDKYSVIKRIFNFNPYFNTDSATIDIYIIKEKQ